MAHMPSAKGPGRERPLLHQPHQQPAPSQEARTATSSTSPFARRGRTRRMTAPGATTADTWRLSQARRRWIPCKRWLAPPDTGSVSTTYSQSLSVMVTASRGPAVPKWVSQPGGPTSPTTRLRSGQGAVVGLAVQMTMQTASEQGTLDRTGVRLSITLHHSPKLTPFSLAEPASYRASCCCSRYFLRSADRLRLRHSL